MKREGVMHEIRCLQAELVAESVQDLGCVACRAPASMCACGEAWDAWTLEAWNRTLWVLGAARLEELLRRAYVAGWRPTSHGEIVCPTCGVAPFLACLGPWTGEEPFAEAHAARTRAWALWRSPRLGQTGLGDFAHESTQAGSVGT